jgi:hypothetical protein
MYLMYVDESGDVGLVNSPTRYFVLCGLVLHELRWRPYLDELIAHRRDLKAWCSIRLREEIHSSELINKPGQLARIPKYQRLEILRRVSDKLGSMPDWSLIPVVVDKQGKPPDYDVFAHAWTALIQRFENTLSAGNFPGPKNSDERGMLFPDRTDDKKLIALLRRMRAFNPVPNQSAFGNGYRNLTLRYVIEDANLRDSRHSYFIQTTDVAAFLLYQSLAPSKYMHSKSGHNYFKRWAPILCRAATRNPDSVVRL